MREVCCGKDLIPEGLFMIPPEQFRAAFADGGLALFKPESVNGLGLPAEETIWLTTVGLPRSAAPGLGFGHGAEVTLPPVEEVWRGMEGLPANRYRMIGSNGSGDPIAIDLAENGAIVFLNHDNLFERVFINSSVQKLAVCLFSFGKLIAATRSTKGEDAYLDGNVPHPLLDAFRTVVSRVDPPALDPGTMWLSEVESLQSEPPSDAGEQPRP